MSESAVSFDGVFDALTGYRPLRWQSRLFNRLAVGDTPPAVALPTALGKTSILPIWLIALAHSAAENGDVPRLPRRLVYIVNRRTVVDQATDIVAQMRERLLMPNDQRGSGHGAVLQSLADALRRLAGTGNPDLPLAVSTLRGELADNGEWKLNPARPAIIIGTIDMIGGKLLFSGYGDGRYGRVHHAGLIGQDALIVHDEAHLTPAFGRLLRAVEQEQNPEFMRDAGLTDITRPIRVMELSATTRSDGGSGREASSVFGIEDADGADSVVQQRLTAEKRLSLVEADAGNKNGLVGLIAEKALGYDGEQCGVLVYVRSPETAASIVDEIQKKLMASSGAGRHQRSPTDRSRDRAEAGEDAGVTGADVARGSDSRVALLTGTIRGYERDRLAESDLFRTFKADPDRPAQLEQTLYLVSTSAGEVGVDLDADHMVCDLTTLDSMIQRFGRVNRLGVDKDGQPRQATITVVMGEADDKDPLKERLKERLQKTVEVLRQLPQVNGTYDASPRALDSLLRTDGAQAAFTPAPEILQPTDILFDAWSLTSIDGDMPGRPAVAEYLHGAAEWEPPETFVAWRAEVRHLAEANVDSDTLSEWFEACPILAHERLRDRTDRVRDALSKLLDKHGKKAKSEKVDFDVVVLNERGEARLAALSELAEKPKGRDPLAYATVVLAVEVGGLGKNGTLDAGVTEARENLDVAEEPPGRTQGSGGSRRRERWLFVRDAEGERWSHLLLTGQETGQRPTDLRERESVTLKEPPEGAEDEGDAKELVLFSEPREAAGENPEQARLFRETLTRHHERVAAHAERIARALALAEDLRGALVLAARWHDQGKDRPTWQRYANNGAGNEALAKSDRYGHWRELGGYRHEFGSLLDAAGNSQVRDHPERDLILHLIAAHHGWARPHFEERAFDNEGPRDPATGQRRRPTTRQNETAAVEAMQRFGRLQQRFGRWGLAWLESLLRCADALASSAPGSAAAVASLPAVASADRRAPQEAAGEATA